jgi:hypothetical protein
VTLSAQGSHDPDQQALTFSWFPYPEAGTFQDELKLSAREGEKTSFTIPRPATVHLILQVQDQGTPSLTSYRRAVFRIQP